jgi:hypothetical protein
MADRHSDTFSTSDTATAAFLSVRGYSVRSVNVVGQSVYFHFNVKAEPIAARRFQRFWRL